MPTAVHIQSVKPTTMKYILLSICICLPLCAQAQTMTGPQLLDKAIAYHDPQGNWDAFKGVLNVTMETPDNPDRDSYIEIDLPQEFFHLKATRGSEETTYTIDRGECTTSMKEDPNAKRTPCETASLYKNYYTYLYGLPMKLKDPGTHIDPVVHTKTFKGKEYLVLKASYDASVGSDVWYFYFDPSTYAMEVYQFYKGDPDAEGKDTGEYILLSEEVMIHQIKMPKVRAWYYNKDDKYLGTDVLKSR